MFKVSESIINLLEVNEDLKDKYNAEMRFLASAVK